MARTKQAAREVLTGKSRSTVTEWYIPAPHDKELSLSGVGATSKEHVEIDGYPYWRFKTSLSREDILEAFRKGVDNNHNYAAALVANFLTTNPSGVHTYKYEYEVPVDSQSFLATFDHELLGYGLITTAEHPYRLLELVSTITDAHVIGETLAYEENFNGERHYVEVPDVLEEPKPKKAVATTITPPVHHIQHAKLFELTNWNRDYVVPEASDKNATYLAHWRTIAQTQPETIDSRLVALINLKSFSDYALASHGEIVADLRNLEIPYVTGMTRFAAIVTAVILRSPSFSKDEEYKSLIRELTPGL